MRNHTAEISTPAPFTSRRLGATSVLLFTLLVSPAARGQGVPVPTAPTEARELPPGAEELPPPSAGALLAERSRQLDAREAELDEAQKDLAAIEKRIEDKIAKLEGLLSQKKQVEKEEMDAAMVEREKRLARMTEVTGKMPPENAAIYLTQLSVDMAAKIVAGIKSRKAAAILAAMDPSKAAEISRKYLKSGKSKRPTSVTSGGRPEAGGGEAAP
ncbi:MAG: hypothetical protein AAFZ18_27555 [Myxococcota bacterium]